MSRHCDLFTGAPSLWMASRPATACRCKQEGCLWLSEAAAGSKTPPPSFSKAGIHFMLMKATIIQDGRQRPASPRPPSRPNVSGPDDFRHRNDASNASGTPAALIKEEPHLRRHSARSPRSDLLAITAAFPLAPISITEAPATFRVLGRTLPGWSGEPRIGFLEFWKFFPR